MTDEEHVLHRVDGGVAWITLNRPDAANAITPDQRNRVIDLLAAASEQLAIRAVVITANGKHFCTGADLRVAQPVVAQPDDAPPCAAGDVARMLRNGSQRLVAAVMDCEKPVIASVNGTAAGIGAHLAFACDLVIAADTAKFIEIFVRRGIVADGGGAYLLPRLIGVQKSKELLFFGDDVSATDAASIGLVNKVVPLAQLEAATTEWASRLATSPTKAIALTKALVNRSLDSSRAEAFEAEAMAQDVAMTTHDAQEGVAAFVERRDPTYKGW